MAVVVAACGDETGGGEAPAPRGGETGSTEGAKAIDPASMENAKGEVTYCMGKDTTGEIKDWVDKFNAKFEPRA